MPAVCQLNKTVIVVNKSEDNPILACLQRGEYYLATNTANVKRKKAKGVVVKTGGKQIWVSAANVDILPADAGTGIAASGQISL